MTNALGIAAVTAVLVDRLRDAVVNAVDAAGGVTVSAMPPARLDHGGDITPGTRLNLFLYRVERNPGWANNELPERSSSGDRISRPVLPLDLHYLLSAYGNNNFEAEIMLGFGLQMMQEYPFFDRQAIRTALGGDRVQAGGLLPDAFGALSPDSLADQIEQIRISPHQWKPDEEWRLWEALHAGLQPSATYKVSVVLLQLEGTTRPSLPVQKSVVFVEQLRHPRITAVSSMTGLNDPPVRDASVARGGHLVLEGSGLQGSETLVRFGQPNVPDVAPASAQPDRVVVQVPVALSPGPTSVQIVHRIPKDPAPGAERISFELSNSVVAGVRPAFHAVNPVAVVNRVDHADGTVSADILVRLDQLIGVDQRTSLLANEADLPVGRVSAAFAVGANLPDVRPPGPDPAVDTVVFSISHVVSTRYLIRVRVDGVDTPLQLPFNPPDLPQPVDLT